MELLIDSRLSKTCREGLTRGAKEGKGRHWPARSALRDSKSSTEATEHSLVLGEIASHGQPAQRGERVKVRRSVVLFGTVTSSRRERTHTRTMLVVMRVS